jgi:molybdenum cofactor biosynthesis enzyme MoaA
MTITDYEIFKFGENRYTEFFNNDKKYLLNKEPYLDVVLTDHCNADCNFCIADLIHKKLNGDLEKFKEKILFAINHMNVREVLVLGGEPTMSSMLIPIVEWLSTLNLDKIVMTTNGIKLAYNHEFRERILSSGLTHINISFMNLNIDKQQLATNSKLLTVQQIEDIYEVAFKYNVKRRINNNIYKGNNDTLQELISFYNEVKCCCDSVKFSPLLPVDNFSVINVKTEWASKHIIPNDEIELLFNKIQDYYTNKYPISIIENDLQFGFVKNTMIPLKVPIILNWNFGDYTGMMKRVAEENKINGIKLLPNNELSLSWNRELPEYYIKTN